MESELFKLLSDEENVSGIEAATFEALGRLSVIVGWLCCSRELSSVSTLSKLNLILDLVDLLEPSLCLFFGELGLSEL